MGADLGRLRAGKKSRTGMNEQQLEDFARKPVVSSYSRASAWHRKRSCRGR